MPRNDRGIGSVGLEQGGPNLGNDYTRPDLTVGNAGDALADPNTTGLKNEDDDSLAMDQESSRDLDDTGLDDADDTDATDDIDDDDELIDDDFDVDEDDEEDFSDLDEDEEDEDNTLERGI